MLHVSVQCVSHLLLNNVLSAVSKDKRIQGEGEDVYKDKTTTVCKV